MSDDLGEVRTRVENHVLVIEIDRQTKRNALTPDLIRSYAEALTRLENDELLWVGVVTFAGDHACAGLDLPKFRGAFTSGSRSAPNGLVDPFQLRDRVTKPVIMAVQGVVYTAGLELMLASDIVVAADSARLCQLEPKRGLAPYGGGIIRFIDRTGWGNAMYHLMRADVIDAQTALRLGFVQEVVPHGRQVERAIELGHELTRCSPRALRWIKKNARTYVRDGEQAAIDMIPEMMRETANSEDAAEGLRAFVERRDAVFTGK